MSNSIHAIEIEINDEITAIAHIEVRCEVLDCGHPDGPSRDVESFDSEMYELEFGEAKISREMAIAMLGVEMIADAESQALVEAGGE